MWNFPGGRKCQEQGEDLGGFSSITVSALKRQQAHGLLKGNGAEPGVAGTMHDPDEFAIHLIKSVKVSTVDTTRYQ